MSRWKAGLIHLCLSALVLLPVTGLVLLWWFPLDYAPISGGLTLVLLLIGVDLVIGPLLTTIVYRAGKPSLRFDLSVIVLLQATALAYGLWTAAEARLAFLVMSGDRIMLAPANLIVADSLQRAQPPFNNLSWTGPVLAAGVTPKDLELQQRLLFSSLEGRDIEAYPAFFEPWAQHREKLLLRAKPVTRLAEVEGGEAALADLRSRFANADTLTYVPVVGSRGSAAAVLDPVSAEPIAIYHVMPW